MRNIVLLAAFSLIVYHSTAQIITTVAGNGTMGYNGDIIPATSAELSYPNIAVPDNHGNLYIAEEGNNRVRKIDALGIITTIAGTGVAGYSGDNGQATDAQLSVPTGIAIDAAGNIFISELGNNCIRKVNTSGIISTIAGTGTTGYGGDNGPAIAAKLWLPRLMAFDSEGNLYVADTHNDRVRKISTSGIITTVAGTGVQGYSGDGTTATAAQLGGPQGVAIDDSGNLYIAESGNSVLRKVSKATGIITTIAGTSVDGFSGDEGPATDARLYGCFGVAPDHAGNIYFTDNQNHRVRKITPDGIIHTVAGDGTSGFNGDNIPATSAHLYYPRGISIDNAGNIFVADHFNDRIRHLDAVASAVKNLAAKDAGISLFPNPNDGLFTMTAELPGADSRFVIDIRTITGATVYHHEEIYPFGIIAKKIQLSSLPPGIYTATITNGEASKTTSFMIR